MYLISSQHLGEVDAKELQERKRIGAIFIATYSLKLVIIYALLLSFLAHGVRSFLAHGVRRGRQIDDGALDLSHHIDAVCDSL